MVRIATVALALVFASSAFAADPTLEERIAKLEKQQLVTDRKLESVNDKLDAILAAVKERRAGEATAVAPKPAATAPSTLISAVAGCCCTGGCGLPLAQQSANALCSGGCGLPIAGQQQAVYSQPAYSYYTQPTYSYYSQPYYSSYSSFTADACANGACAVPTSTRRGLFSFRRW